MGFFHIGKFVVHALKRQRRRLGITGHALINNADVAPTNLNPLIVFTVSNAVDLKGNKTGTSHGIVKMGGRNIIDPGLKSIANRFDTEFVPLIRLERLLSSGVIFKRIQPAAATFIINAPRPGAGGRVNFDLIPMNPVIQIFGEVIGTNLNSRVKSRIDLKFDFKNEIGIILLGAKKTIRCTRNRSPDNGPIFYRIVRLSALLYPAVKCLPVK